MPISHATHKIAIDQIIVQREQRQREKIEVEDLKISLQRNGLINPIVVERDTLILVAGERRLTAMRELGWTETHVRFAEDATTIDLQILELEENLKRKDLEWHEDCKATARIHELFCQQDKDWTLGETASALGITIATVSYKIKITAEIENGNAHLKEATQMRQARNILIRKEQRAAAKDLEALLDVAPPIEIPERGQEQRAVASTSSPVQELDGTKAPVKQTLVSPPADVICKSFLDWAPSYSGPKFNFVHCDFPYGVNLFTGGKFTPAQEGTYDDSKDVYFALLECFCKNLENFCSLSAHVIFWYSREHEDATRAMFRNFAPSIEWVRDPLIWGKTDNAGIARDMRRGPRHIYENALFGYRGKRMTVKQKGDFYAGPTANQLHPSAKPIPMLNHFFEMVVDENTEMLDPTCGSGTSLCSADKLGAKRVFGMDIDPEHVKTAQTQLNNQRKLIKATK